MKLIKISEDYAEQIKDYRQEFLDAGDSMDGCGSLRVMDDPYEFIKKCKNYESPATLPEGRVIATQFLFVREEDDRLVGMLQVRHYFNDYLSKFGGHIGYSVRPSERRMGYAKAMLGAALPFCREIGLEKVLVTCYEDNIASAKTIISCGGRFESLICEQGEKINYKRYWIET